jgi:hypothetical protein
MMHEVDEVDDDDDGETCPRCGPRVDVAPLDASLSPALGVALARCARCLAHDGLLIDRAHVAEAEVAFGAFAQPLESYLAERARSLRPELAGATLLVADPETPLVQPVEIQHQRLASLQRIGVPDLLLEGARAALAAAEAAGPIVLGWDRVFAWPAPEQFPGTVACGEIARTLAEHAIPPLVEPHDRAEILGAIDWAIANLVLDDEMLAYRHELAERGLALPVRFLDQLGRTDLLTNQDTLLDDCYVTLLRAGHAAAAAHTYRTWLEVAVPRALAKLSALARARAGH